MQLFSIFIKHLQLLTLQVLHGFGTSDTFGLAPRMQFHNGSPARGHGHNTVGCNDSSMHLMVCAWSSANPLLARTETFGLAPWMQSHNGSPARGHRRNALGCNDSGCAPDGVCLVIYKPPATSSADCSANNFNHISMVKSFNRIRSV